MLSSFHSPPLHCIVLPLPSPLFRFPEDLTSETYRMACKADYARENNLIADNQDDDAVDNICVRLNKAADPQVREQEGQLESKEGERVDRAAGVLDLVEGKLSSSTTLGIHASSELCVDLPC